MTSSSRPLVLRTSALARKQASIVSGSRTLIAVTVNLSSHTVG